MEAINMIKKNERKRSYHFSLTKKDKKELKKLLRQSIKAYRI